MVVGVRLTDGLIGTIVDRPSSPAILIYTRSEPIFILCGATFFAAWMANGQDSVKAVVSFCNIKGGMDIFFFNKEDVYIGFSMEELSKVRAVLKREGIKYTYKIIDPSGQWLGPGTSRGNFGSFGMNKNYEKQYVVSVRKKDAENAKYLVHSVLHS